MNKLKVPERKVPEGKTVDDVANEIQKAIDAGKRSITVKGPFAIESRRICGLLEWKGFDARHDYARCQCGYDSAMPCQLCERYEYIEVSLPYSRNW